MTTEIEKIRFDVLNDNTIQATVNVKLTSFFGLRTSEIVFTCNLAYKEHYSCYITFSTEIASTVGNHIFVNIVSMCDNYVKTGEFKSRLRGLENHDKNIEDYNKSVSSSTYKYDYVQNKPSTT